MQLLPWPFALASPHINHGDFPHHHNKANDNFHNDNPIIGFHRFDKSHAALHYDSPAASNCHRGLHLQDRPWFAQNCVYNHYSGKPFPLLFSIAAFLYLVLFPQITSQFKILVL